MNSFPGSKDGGWCSLRVDGGRTHLFKLNDAGICSPVIGFDDFTFPRYLTMAGIHTKNRPHILKCFFKRIHKRINCQFFYLSIRTSRALMRRRIWGNHSTKGWSSFLKNKEMEKKYFYYQRRLLKSSLLLPCCTQYLLTYCWLKIFVGSEPQSCTSGTKLPISYAKKEGIFAKIFVCHYLFLSLRNRK